ncbi:MAG: cytochrome c1, partial [Pseudomonadota bacterium]
GFIAFAASVAIPFVLPWLDRSPVRSWRYRGNINKVMLVLFVACFLILGVLGVKSPTPERTFLAQICSIFYFGFFLFMPVWSAIDKTKPVPERVTMDGGIGPLGTIGGFALIMVLTIIPLKVVGAESAFNCGTIPCDEIDLDIYDKESMQNGAKIYMNYCMGCHSLKYARYNRVADDLGIPYDLMEEHIIADPSVKIGSLMDNAMDTKSAKNWFGAAPPDLTLVARSRNPDWLYTYLRSFYRDDTRPYGVNNRVYPNVGMPHALLELQGLLECSDGHGDGNASDSHGDESHGSACELTSEGSQTTDEYDGTIYDLVNFLAYVAEPMKADRQRIGVYALLLIAIFYVFASLLNREYWKDVH